MTLPGSAPADTSLVPEPASAMIADVDAARWGDRAAFARLYARMAPVVHAVAISHVRHARDAEDVTQEVFARVLAKLGDLRESAAFPGWVMAIARNAARDWKKPALRLAGEIADTARPSEATNAELSERATRALDAVRGLPEAYRETLMMRLVSGLTGPQIAERTGMTEGSVRVNLCRGMAMLKAVLEDGAGGAGGGKAR